MACFGDYEIVTTNQSVSFASGNEQVVVISVPTGKKAIYGWCGLQVALLLGRPVQDGDAWEFTVRGYTSGTVSVEFGISCAYLD